MKIRYLTKKDAEFFREEILNDDKGSKMLAHSGGVLLDSEHSRWSNGFVAEENGKLLGFSYLDFKTNTGEGYIGATYVCKDGRRKGVASKLIKFLEKYAKRNYPVRRMSAITVENPKMWACLLKNGFIEMGLFKEGVFYDGRYMNEHYWVKKYD